MMPLMFLRYAVTGDHCPVGMYGNVSNARSWILTAISWRASPSFEDAQIVPHDKA